MPRDEGGLVLGATQTEVGFDTTVTVGGVRDLLRDAERILPGIAEYALVESAAGLRPGSPDNLPLIGALGPEGLLVATGHHRNGMLLAPVTADAVAALLRGDPVPGAGAGGRPGPAGRHEHEEVARGRLDQRERRELDDDATVPDALGALGLPHTRCGGGRRRRGRAEGAVGGHGARRRRARGGADGGAGRVT